MAYDFYKDTANKKEKIGWGALSTVWNAVLGFADWIGLGTAIRGILDNNMPEDMQKDKIQARLTAKINELINNGDERVAQLEDKLAGLKNAGFALSGVALRNLQQDARKTTNEIKSQKVKNARNKVDLTLAQNDIDSLKGFTEASDLRDVVNLKNKADHIEQEINKIGQGV